MPGNPVYTPGSTDIVPVGKPFTITWDGSGLGSTVTLVLLRGPSTNVVPIGAIVENTPNSGSYVWTPSDTLQDDVTGYGIQMIDDATGEYQYTTQFGVSNKDSAWPSSAPAAPPPASSAGWPARSGSAAAWPTTGQAWPSKPAHPSKPVQSEEPCTESEQSWPTSPPSGQPSGAWPAAPAASGWASSNSSGWASGSFVSSAVTPSATYTPTLSNDAGRFTMSFGGCVIALGAAVMLL